MKSDLRHIATVALFSIAGIQPSSASTINMMSVVYGNLQYGKTCDATKHVMSLCNGRQQCSVDIGNTSLCGDPDFLTVKKAVIDFKCGRIHRRIVQDEYHAANVACD